MTGAMLRHRFTTGRQMWLIIAVTLRLALGSEAAADTECQRETSLPANVRLIVPRPDVPGAVARFAEAWIGEWEHSGGLYHTLSACGTSRQMSSLAARGTVGQWAGALLHHVPGGEAFELAATDRWGKERYHRVPGNPEGY